MRKLQLCLIILFLTSVCALAQETITVISVKANLRGTPASNGIVVTTVNQDEEFELIKKQGAWFLVQTPKYVGWIHGNAIRLETANSYEPRKPSILEEAFGINSPEKSYVEPRKPRKSTKTVIEEDKSPFVAEYVGEDVEPTVYIKNSSNRLMTLTLGGVRYPIKAGFTQVLNLENGAYDFSANAPGVIPLTGTKKFQRSYNYTWEFYIITTRLR